MFIKRFLGIILVGVALAFATCVGKPTTINAVGMELDEAIKEAVVQMETRIPARTMVALISIASPSTAFSTQVLTRLESALVSNGKVVVVDRANLDKVRAEQGFQLSGEVDDESAKSIGKLLGAGAIVTGSLADLGDVYSLTLKAINIETATVTVSYLADLAKTRRIETLLASRDGVASNRTETTTSTMPASGNSGTRAQPTTLTYRIGDLGPARGIIFYDKGNNRDGWRYLEIAPPETERRLIMGRGLMGSSQEQRIGFGKENTKSIMDFFSKNGGEVNTAAWYCDNLVINGFDDWFLPSSDELMYIYANLYTNNIGNIKSVKYWSSTYWGLGAYYFINLSDGERDKENSSNNNLVRAIRRF